MAIVESMMFAMLLGIKLTSLRVQAQLGRLEWPWNNLEKAHRLQQTWAMTVGFLG